MSFLAECNIPSVVTGILSQLYRILIVLIPIGIVIFGSIDFIKATVAKDENAIATSSKTFISRLITGCITFFVLTIVNWLFTVIIGSVGGANSAMACALQILNGTATETSTNNNTSNNNINGGYNGTRDCYYSNKSICLGKNYQSPNKEQECTDFANEQCQTNYYTTTTTTTYSYIEVIKECLENKQNLAAYENCKANLIVKDSDGSINFEATMYNLNTDNHYSVNYQETINTCTSAITYCYQYIDCMDEVAVDNNLEFIDLDNGDPCKNLQYNKNNDRKEKCKTKYNQFNEARKKFNGQFPDPDDRAAVSAINDDVVIYCKTEYANKIWLKDLETTIEEVCKAQVCPN